MLSVVIADLQRQRALSVFIGVAHRNAGACRLQHTDCCSYRLRAITFFH